MPKVENHRWSVPTVAAIVVVVVCCAVVGSADSQDTDYSPTLPEDPLQSVWDTLDTIPVEIINGLKDQIDLHTRHVQTSLTKILSRLSALEDKMQQDHTSLREDIGDLVTDRLVNAEAIILEDMSKLSTAMTSNVREHCSICGKVEPLSEKFDEVVNATVTTATTCSSQAEDEVARVEEAVTRIEQVAAKVEEKAKRVDAAATKVEGMADREMQRDTTNPPAASTRMDAAYLPCDCSDLHWQQPEAPSGVYRTFPTLDPKAAVTVYCDMGRPDAKETGGWTIVLRRHNTSSGLENFNRTWVEYQQGFGQPGEGEWWYGLAPLHTLTYRQPFQVEFILHELELGTFYATYSTFRVENERRNFSLVVSGFSGNMSYDALATHHGEAFSTYDNDLDAWDEGNCASNNGGGWWYGKCHQVSLTATFPASLDRDARTISWYTPDGRLVFDDVIMKIRPTNYGHRFHTDAD